MALKLKTLAKLQFRQLSRNKSKGRLYGDIFGVVYFWIIEFVVFFLLREDGTTVPPIAVALVAIGFTIPDLILKFVLERDNTVMDAFLKTRPLSQSRWEDFLALSQFWNESNLVMPLALLPACFLFIPPIGGLILFVALYLASVLGGYIVMAVKHRGNYQPEKAVKSYLSKSVKSARGNYISGIQFRSFLRSKRLKTTMIYLSVFFYVYSIIYSLDDTRPIFGIVYVFFFIFLLSCSMPQWGFAVEANFFGGIWTRPIAIERLLANKYRFGLLCGSVGGLLCLPLCIWSESLSPFDIIASVLYCSCFGNLLMLMDAYNCVPFDMFGKAFFNNQGSSSTYKGATIIVTFAIMGVGLACLHLLPGWKSQVILSALGLGGVVAYKPFFRWVVRRFMRNRYKYMEKYTSK